LDIIQSHRFSPTISSESNCLASCPPGSLIVAMREICTVTVAIIHNMLGLYIYIYIVIQTKVAVL
jgi:hypothetical protein